MGERKGILEFDFYCYYIKEKVPCVPQILSIDISTPIPGMMNSGEQWQLSRYHTHLLILAMVVSATRTKSSAGESCTPLGNRNWSSKTFTSLVSVSYSSRLSVPTAKGHTGRIHDPPAGLEPCSPLDRDLQKGSQPHTGVTKPLVVFCSDLVPGWLLGGVPHPGQP